MGRANPDHGQRSTTISTRVHCFLRRMSIENVRETLNPHTVRLALLGMNTTDPRKSLPANLFPTALCHLCEVSETGILEALRRCLERRDEALNAAVPRETIKAKTANLLIFNEQTFSSHFPASSRGVQHCKAARNLGVGAGEQRRLAATCPKVAAIIQLGSRSDSIQFALLAGGCWISCAASRKGPRATGCDVLVRLNIDTQRATCDDEAAAAAAAASDACPLARFLHSLDSSQGYNCHRQLRTVAAKRFEWFPKRKDSARSANCFNKRKKKQEKKKKRRVGTRREEHGGPSLRTAGNSAQPPPTGTSDESIDLGVGLKTPLSPAPLASARTAEMKDGKRTYKALRIVLGEQRETYWLSAKLSNGRSKRNTLN
ncbi:hypothetical protein ALC60_08999 [Trachymyrmex zeteki]|uniref:Uncharacterized protein n=1 Tax=Mycetomoellerius zeteki TaxID=64791 RepID=A0A151WVH7_9HYME|nr:hypothetical protein ALC60_08999 [Trachymyrmex zeteki]